MSKRKIQNKKWMDGWIKHNSNEAEDYKNVSRHRLENREKIRVVCCSDTHGNHRKVDVPNGDIFIHAGDFTRFGKLEDAIDFNNWLGEEEIFGDFKLKVVVNGNHECNAPWQAEISHVLSNANFLKNDWCEYSITPTKHGSDEKKSIKIYGTDFYWPMKTRNPYYEIIPDDIDVLVSHGPTKGYVDGNHGCPVLLDRIKEINRTKACNPISSLVGIAKNFFMILMQIVFLLISFPSTVVLKTAFSNFKDWPKLFKINLENKKLDIKTKYNDLKNCFQFAISIGKTCFLNSNKNCTKSRSDNIRLVVSGHIHESHGISKMERTGYTRTNTVFVNAAIARNNYEVGWKAVVIDL